MHYIRGWFLFDVISSLPYEQMIHQGDHGIPTTSIIALLKVRLLGHAPHAVALNRWSLALVSLQRHTVAMCGSKLALRLSWKPDLVCCACRSHASCGWSRSCGC